MPMDHDLPFRVFNRSSESMRELPDGSVNLIITSPPYNVGVRYDRHNDGMETENYVNMLMRVLVECYRVLPDGGRLVLNVGDYSVGTDKPLLFLAADLMQEAGFIHRANVIWNKGHIYRSSMGTYLSALSPGRITNHEYLMIYCKGQWAHPNGTYVQTMTSDEFRDSIKSVWSVRPGRKHGHPAEMPEELADRAIKLLSFPGDVVLDPFCGSGTTLAAAVKQGRMAIGYDISENYCGITEARCQKALELPASREESWLAALIAIVHGCQNIWFYLRLRLALLLFGEAKLA